MSNTCHSRVTILRQCGLKKKWKMNRFSLFTFNKIWPLFVISALEKKFVINWKAKRAKVSENKRGKSVTFKVHQVEESLKWDCIFLFYCHGQLFSRWLLLYHTFTFFFFYYFDFVPLQLATFLLLPSFLTSIKLSMYLGWFNQVSIEGSRLSSKQNMPAKYLKKLSLLSNQSFTIFSHKPWCKSGKVQLLF